MARDAQQRQGGFWSHVFTIPNIGSVLVGLTVFWLIADSWRSPLGTAGAAVVGALVTALVWILWVYMLRGPRLEKTVDEPIIAYVPTTEGIPTPALSMPVSGEAETYLDAIAALERASRGQVIMVAGAGPGLGATTVAMNLAVAATRMGRRAVLIDADPGGGMSEYGQSDTTPGWIDLALGAASLKEATRLWRIDEANTLPFIPVGTDVDDRGEALGSLNLADTIDKLTEHADLLIVNTAPVDWDTSLRHVATHADGTLLVVTPDFDPRRLAPIAEQLVEMSAPIIGYIVNRAERRPDRRPLWRRSLKRMLTTFMVLIVVYSAWNLYSVWQSWNNVERFTFDQLALDQLPEVPPPSETGETLTPEVVTAVTATPTEDVTYETYMLVGIGFGDILADVIILVMLPEDGSSPLMVSLPRDLYLPNRCTQDYTRLNANLNGCGDEINGLTLLSGAVQDFTGMEVDHFALFTFEGFEQIIDEVGGVEICVDYAVYDYKAKLDLPAGCTNATGAQALGWVRSRKTRELVDGVWRVMPNVSDLTRNERQQDVILTMLEKASQFDSPSELAGVVRSVSKAFTLDDQLGLSDVIGLAWDLRSLDREDVVRLKVPVEFYETAEGAQVLVATKPFDNLLEEYIAAPLPDLPE